MDTAIAGYKTIMEATTFRGTITKATHFNPENDAKKIRESLKADSPDSQQIIQILTTSNNAQRQEIKACYKAEYDRDLEHDLKKETMRDYHSAVLALFMAPLEYDAYCLNKAVSGLGTDEKALTEILISRSNEDIRKISELYGTKYGKELEKDIAGDTSGDFREMLLILAKGSREEVFSPSMDSARGIAAELAASKDRKFPKDERLNDIFCRKSFAELKLIFQEYEKITGKDLLKTIKSETSGDHKDGLIAIIEYIRDPVFYFAEKLHRSMHGAGTDSFALTRLIVTRSEIDLKDIKVRFQKEHGKSLSKYIEGDTSGSYRKLLLAIVKE